VRTEFRFVLAVALMFLVLMGTNRLFPPVIPEETLSPDSSVADSGGGVVADDPDGGPVLPSLPEVLDDAPAGAPSEDRPEEGLSERQVIVESPLYRFSFSSYGARLISAELPQFQALNREGLVDLIPEGVEGQLSQRLIVGSDTVDLSRVPYTVEPEGGLSLSGSDEAGILRFTYQNPTSDFRFTMSYTFNPDTYSVRVSGELSGLPERPVLLTDLGEGVAFTEADSAQEARTMAYVHNHLDDGIQSTILDGVEPEIVQGPLLWAAFRSKFFVTALLAGESEEGTSEDLTTDRDYLSALIVREGSLPERVKIETAQSVGNDGRFTYRLFMGPQEYTRLSSLGQGMEEVNPYGWRFFRPIIRPFVSVIMAILVFLHTNLAIGYGWVLIVFGVAMRIVLFPLNHRAMKAQLRNMSVQPLVQEIQKKYKGNPEKLQKEMMRLYKEHGFNPLAGCLPMLLPFPMLIALFFVFQNTIELRGVPFLWLADLSAKDPLFILPVLLAISMFLMQWVSLRSLDQPNPQMKMMMWMMPPFMLFIFMNLASGLNLYYATANIATIPQQMWIAGERKKMKGQPPPKLESD
jgi:YidC/Oxa1 family membrane protein insertase